MTRVVIFGNSGSGKSTLAKALAAKHAIAHLDLDTIAWQPAASTNEPPQRMAIADSKLAIDEFVDTNQDWVIEGCYADLLTLVTAVADEMIFLNLPVTACIENAKNRPWEPHKYESKAAQDANLDMLIEWIAQYEHRTDHFSKAAHQMLFDQFTGKKVMFESN